MRYFMVTANINTDNKDILVNSTMECNVFPSVRDINKGFKQIYPGYISNVITNIFEFKCEDDYKSFLEH